MKRKRAASCINSGHCSMGRPSAKARSSARTEELWPQSSTDKRWCRAGLPASNNAKQRAAADRATSSCGWAMPQRANGNCCQWDIFRRRTKSRCRRAAAKS
eukprot:2140568-Alexandrium_andersonii.AAC.2